MPNKEQIDISIELSSEDELVQVRRRSSHTAGESGAASVGWRHGCDIAMAMLSLRDSMIHSDFGDMVKAVISVIEDSYPDALEWDSPPPATGATNDH